MSSLGAEAREAETARVRAIWEREAPHYDRVISWCERLLFTGEREWVGGRVTGEVLEVAVGTGRNLPYYPSGIKLSGIDFSPAMLALAGARADELGMEVDLQVADAQKLPYEGDSFDCVVCTLSLCSIPDHVAAIDEISRVLRDEGKLVMVEHVRSPRRPVHIIQRALEPLTVRLGGDHLTRDPAALLEGHGFLVETLVRLKWGIIERVVARKINAQSPLVT